MQCRLLPSTDLEIGCVSFKLELNFNGDKCPQVSDAIHIAQVICTVNKCNSLKAVVRLDFSEPDDSVKFFDSAIETCEGGVSAKSRTYGARVPYYRWHKHMFNESFCWKAELNSIDCNVNIRAEVNVYSSGRETTELLEFGGAETFVAYVSKEDKHEEVIQ